MTLYLWRKAIQMTVDFSSKTMEARGSSTTFLKYWKVLSNWELQLNCGNFSQRIHPSNHTLFALNILQCYHYTSLKLKKGFPGGSEVKASACNGGEVGSIPGLGRSPGEGNGNPLQYSCLENPMDGGAWWATVHGVAKSRTRLSDFTFTFTFKAEKRLATKRWMKGVWGP